MSEHEQIEQRKALMSTVQARIAADPQFGRDLLEHPRQALRAAGLEDTIKALQYPNEVTGYVMAPADGTGLDDLGWLFFLF